jgi:5-methylcytosine-specific restriction enzyme subunit McrC
MDDVPSVQKIDVRDPISSSNMASVILRPVNLIKVAKLVSDDSMKLKLVEFISILLRNT